MHPTNGLRHLTARSYPPIDWTLSRPDENRKVSLDNTSSTLPCSSHIPWHSSNSVLCRLVDLLPRRPYPNSVCSSPVFPFVAHVCKESDDKGTG